MVLGKFDIPKLPDILFENGRMDSIIGHMEDSIIGGITDQIPTINLHIINLYIFCRFVSPYIYKKVKFAIELQSNQAESSFIELRLGSMSQYLGLSSSSHETSSSLITTKEKAMQ